MISDTPFYFNAAFIAFFASGLSFMLYFTRQRTFWRRLGYIFAMAAWSMLTLVMVGRAIAAQSFAVFGLYDSLLFFSWVIVAAYFFSERKGGNGVHAIFVLPLIVLLLGVANFLDKASRPLPPALQSPWLGFHVAFCFLGYACFLIGFCSAILYLWQEREVKSRKIDRYFFRLPSLGVLDSFGYKAIICGFVCLSLGIISGSVWAQRAWGSFWSWDPKETSSLVLWLVYLVYLHNRLTRGWIGRRSAYLAIAGFLIMLFTYFGVSLLLPGLHAYL
jgi:cytochrome c-type biogenesis protein CcsB